MDIIMCFHPRFRMTRQFRVGPYRVDLYIHEVNIVVECDENDHANYDPDSESKRTTEINRILAPKWVRYNPDDRIYGAVQQINALIYAIYDSAATTSAAEISALKQRAADSESKLKKISALL